MVVFTFQNLMHRLFRIANCTYGRDEFAGLEAKNLPANCRMPQARRTPVERKTGNTKFVMGDNHVEDDQREFLTA